MKLRNIEILEKDKNKKGDLFGRLIGDLFHSLGYDEPRFNIHKSGREIDLKSVHRTEKKIAIAECKAHEMPIGGSDVNKFIGVVGAEKNSIKKLKNYKGYNVIPYFVSLSGYKESAKEQENDLDNKRVILVDASKIVQELVHGRIIVSPEIAISSLRNISVELVLLPHFDLLAYDKGWIWAFYYSETNGQTDTHFALVHADGKPLVNELAIEIILKDLDNKKVFNKLSLLNSESQSVTSVRLDLAKEKYFHYLENELGEIQFEGLPTDKDAGTVKVKLENIFVPLHFYANIDRISKKELSREGIGEILDQKTKLAILAKPGGGKSTLLKRIAIAYAFPKRRNEIGDSLPDKNWFPIF